MKKLFLIINLMFAVVGLVQADNDKKSKSGSESPYTKIANDGSTLPNNAVLGANPKDWACTKDNKTGLVWEVKTTEGGLHDMSKTYTNYTANYPKCNHTGSDSHTWCSVFFADNNKISYGDSMNADGFVKAVNTKTLCGKNDWRLPTKVELESLVFCSGGKEVHSTKDYEYICTSVVSSSSPTINVIYFPNTSNSSDGWFWTSSPSSDGISSAQYIKFSNGSTKHGYKEGNANVRLVRSGK